MFGWTLLTLALAAKPSAEQLEAEWLALQHLELDTERYRIVQQPIEVHDGPVTLTLTSGVMVPVFSGHFANDRKADRKAKADAWKQGSYVMSDGDTEDDREFVGFVFTAAKGTYSVNFPERAQGMVWATHQVRDLHADAHDWRHVAHGEAWTGPIGEGLVLSIDPELQRKFLGPSTPDIEPDPFDIVVYGEKPRPGALLRAKTIFQARRQLWTEVQLAPGRWMAQDRLAEVRGLGDESGAHGLIEFRTETELGKMGFTATTQPKGLRWLSLLIDERGELDPRKRSILTVLDRDTVSEPVIAPLSGQVFDVDEFGVPRATTRIVGDQAQVRIVAVPRASDIPVTFEADLRLTATGGPMQWFALSLPRAGDRLNFTVKGATLVDGTSVLSHVSNVTFDRSFQLTGPVDPNDERLDNTNTLDPNQDRTAQFQYDQAKQPKISQNDPYLRRDEARITIALPKPLADGESVVIHVEWRDIWPYGNMEVTPYGFMDLIPGTGMQRVFPRPEGTTAVNPWRFNIVAMTPSDRPLVFALPGDEVSQREEDGWRIQTAKGGVHPGAFTEVAASAWKPRFAPAAAGMPAIDTYVSNPKEGVVLASQFRQISNFYQGYLPPYPWPRQVIFEAPSELSEYHWLAGHNLTQVMRTSVMDATARGKFSEQIDPAKLFAHSVARHWWGQLVQFPHAEDFWMSESLSESFACAYLDAIHGGCDALLDRYADNWERFDSTPTPRASLTQAYSGQPNQGAVVYDYGTYVMHRMLKGRIGNQAYHQALDLLAREHAYQSVTTEHLKNYFSLTSGQDLADFFDFWVYAGFVPRQIRLVWSSDAGTVSGEVTTDLPFGTFDVQVVVDGAPIWVTVVDGVGQLEVPTKQPVQEVLLDPNRLTLTSRRIVNRR